MREFRTFIHIRARGQTPFDSREFKSEDFDSYEEYALAVYNCILDNIGDFNEGEDGDDDTDDN